MVGGEDQPAIGVGCAELRCRQLPIDHIECRPSSKRPSAAYSSRIKVGVSTSKRAAPCRISGICWIWGDRRAAVIVSAGACSG